MLTFQKIRIPLKTQVTDCIKKVESQSEARGKNMRDGRVRGGGPLRPKREGV